ncbi:MAG: ATP-binding protein [Victivallales bacterium]
MKRHGGNNGARDLNLGKSLTLVYRRVILTTALIFTVFIAVLLINQYFNTKKHMIKAFSDDLEERSDGVDYFLSNAAEDVIESKIWAENYLGMSQEGPAVSQLIGPIRLDSSGNLSIEPPSNKDAYGNIVVPSGSAIRDIDTIRQINMAFKLFDIQRINHYAPPDFTWSEFYSVKGFISIYPWSDIENITKIRQGRITKEMLRQFELEAENGKKKGAFESNVWSDVYVDVSGRGLMITCGSPVFDRGKFIGMVSAEMGMDFFNRFVEKPETHNSTIMIVNNKGQVMAATEMPPESLERVSSIKDKLPEIKLDTVFLKGPKTQKSHYIHLGKNHIIINRLSKADWIMLKVVPETDIMRAFVPETLFGFIVLVLMFGFLVAAARVINRYFVNPTIGFVEFIETEATGIPALRPNVPPAWEQWFVRISDTLALKSVAANIPGAIFQLKKTRNEKMVLTIVSSGVEQLLGVSVETLVNMEHFTLNFIQAGDAGLFEERIRASENDLTLFTFETIVRIPSGADRWVRFILQPRKEQGKDSETVWDGLMLDISDRKNLEDELRLHRDQLEETVASRTSELKLANTALKISEERIREMSRQVICAQDDERERLSRELHDEIGQQVAAILFQMPTIRKKSPITPEDIIKLEEMIKDIGEYLHRICMGLRPMTLTQFGLGPALKMLLWELMDIYGIKIVASIESLDHCVDNELAAAVYRICQESVMNSIRHSGASEINVSLNWNNDDIILEVVDNGKGFNVDTACDTGNLGIKGMTERAEHCGGGLDVESAPGRGTRVVFTCSIQKKE